MTPKEVDRDSDSDGQGPSEVKTVPPPAGASDAYNAPTRVAELDASAYAALLEQYAAPQLDVAGTPPDPPGEDASEPVSWVEPASRGEPAPLHLDERDAAVELSLVAASAQGELSPPTGDEIEVDVAAPAGSRWTLVGWLALATVVVAFAVLVAMWLTR